MKESTNGETKSPDDNIKEQTELLDKFEKQCALPDCKSPGEESELSQYLNMPLDQIQALSASECSEIGYRLTQFSIYLQRVLNRQVERINWIETHLNKNVAKRIQNYAGNWTMSRQAAILDNSACIRYQEIQIQCQQRKDRLEFLSKCIMNLVDQLKNLSFIKRSEVKE